LYDAADVDMESMGLAMEVGEVEAAGDIELGSEDVLGTGA
jgi:hypothetical protein